MHYSKRWRVPMPLRYCGVLVLGGLFLGTAWAEQREQKGGEHPKSSLPPHRIGERTDPSSANVAPHNRRANARHATPPPPRFETPRAASATEPAEGQGNRKVPMFLGRPLVPIPPVFVNVQPPPLRPESPPPRPSPAYVWIPGYWSWQDSAHVWVPGEWTVPPLPGYVWLPATWQQHGHGWEYAAGHWEHHHGPIYVETDVVPTGASPARHTIIISGHVTDLDGAPVPGVVVKMSGPRRGKILTDDNGDYRFVDLPMGSYTIRPTASGCAFAPDVSNLKHLKTNVAQDIIVSGCPGWD